MKLAFCFLSYNDIEQHDIWLSFFERGNKDQYVIYLHRSDGIRESSLPGCNVIPTIPTAWGKFSLLQAQQNMYNEAIRDPDVCKFILLSGDSIPLYSFSKIYQHLMKDDKGYMQLIAESSTVTYTSDAWPVDKPWKGHFISQWVILNRFHVQLLQENWTMLEKVFTNAHAPDEFMYFIFFNGYDCIDSFNKSSHMYVNHATDTIACSIAHHAKPLTYHRNNFTPLHVEQIYSTKRMFLRKICPKTVVRMDWNMPYPLRNNGSNSLMNMVRRGRRQGI